VSGSKPKIKVRLAALYCASATGIPKHTTELLIELLVKLTLTYFIVLWHFKNETEYLYKEFFIKFLNYFNKKKFKLYIYIYIFKKKIYIN